MGASRVFAGCLLLLMVGLCSGAQDAGAPSGQSSSKPQGHRSGHHIQVEDEDSPAQPAELTEAESAIEKRDYAAAEPLLRKLLDRQPASYVGWFDLGFVENELGRVG